MPIIDHFGLIAPLYERMIGARDESKLAHMLGLPSSPRQARGRLLDAGGGTGRVSQALQSLAEACVVVDESDKMLAFAAQKPGLLPTRAAAERLPYPDDSFDYIIMIDALHHVADQQATAKELWRVCKPGGRIVIEEPDLRRFMVKLVSLGEKLMLMRTKIIMPEAIQALFPKSSQVVKDNFAVWVVIDK